MKSVLRITLLVVLLIISANGRAQTITTVAGNGTAGHSGDNGDAATASIYYPIPGVFDSRGSFYFVEFGGVGHRIRKIDVAGVITTVAGTASPGYNGDGILATIAQLRSPSAVIVDSLDNIFICDHDNHRIRKVDVVTGIITTVAGNGIPGYSGDNSLATNAQIRGPADICFDKKGNLYIGDVNNYRVRKVDNSGIITTYAGNGTSGCGGGFATAAQISPSGICVDNLGNLYISDASTGENRIAKVDITSRIITTVAGTCSGYIYNGDNILATTANINPSRIRFDNSYSNLYFSDVLNNRIRRVISTGYVQNVAGSGIQGFSGDGGSALTAELFYPSGLTFDSCGNLFIGDSYNHRIRKIALNPDCIPMAVPEVTQSKTTNAIIYPNPATESVTINASVAIEHITISNLLGQVVLEQHPTGGKKSVEATVQHLPAGIYVVRVNGIYAGRMVKED